MIQEYLKSRSRRRNYVECSWCDCLRGICSLRFASRPAENYAKHGVRAAPSSDTRDSNDESQPAAGKGWLRFWRIVGRISDETHVQLYGRAITLRFINGQCDFQTNY